jgi:hypothetical protein
MPDIVAAADGCADTSALLPVDPFTAVRYHFGMLLGVDDFETDQAYHRGKNRLTNAWSHRAGVLWGLGVKADLPSGEIRVESGLALDGAGEELHLDAEACLNVGAWFDAHKSDAGFVPAQTAGGYTFAAHVEIKFHPCLTRQVPAMTEPCTGAAGDTAYSRVFETVELHLVPGAASPSSVPYHRLRLLFALEDPIQNAGAVVPSDQEVLDARTHVLSLPATAQPTAYLEAFRRFAALDEIDLTPAQNPDGQGGSLLFPVPDATPVVLANLTDISIAGQAGNWTLKAATVDPTVRPSHVATATIQELVCGPLLSSFGALADAGGPRIDRGSVKTVGTSVTMTVVGPLEAASVVPAAFSVSAFGGAGWTTLAVNTSVYSNVDNTITLTLAATGAGQLVRVIARGTGDHPLLGTNKIPLTGAVGGPAGTADDGNDFVLMQEGS